MIRRIIIIHLLLLAALLNFTSCKNTTETPEQKSGYKMISETFYSTFVGDSIRLDISFPTSYEKDSLKNFRIIYLTDGYWRKGDHDTIHKMGDGGEIPEAIIVGIGYPDGYDFDHIRVRDLINHPDLFLSCIKEEVIPKVEEGYRADSTDRTLWGSSYGGFFLFYTFTEHIMQGSLFKNYICASVPLNPSLNCANLIKQEEELWNSTKSLPVNLYVTVGSNEVSSYISSYNKIVEGVESHPYTNFNFEHEVIPGTDHYSVWKPTLLKGLKMFLNK